MTTKKQPNLERDVEIFIHWLSSQSYAETGKKFVLTGTRIRAIRDRIGRQISTAIRHGEMKSPGMLASDLDGMDLALNKEHWIAMATALVQYVRSKENLTTASPIRHFNVNGMAHDRLEKIGVKTLGDLLDKMRDENDLMKKTFQFSYPSVRTFEVKLTEHGFDPYGGRDQNKQSKENK